MMDNAHIITIYLGVFGIDVGVFGCHDQEVCGY